MNSKPFKETKVGQWLSANAPQALQTLGDFAPAPVKGALDVVSNLIGGQTQLSPEQKAEGQQLCSQTENELIEADMADLANARNREIQVADSQAAPFINKITLPLLAILVSIAFFGLIWYMVKFEVPPTNKSLLDIMIGSLGTAWTGVITYYFGSSAGSKQKDETISKLSN